MTFEKNYESVETENASIAARRLYNRAEQWLGDKATDNPKIAPGNNPSSDTEQYTPAFWYDGNGTLYCLVKSDELNSNTNTLFRYWISTDDGDSFSLDSTTFGPSDLSAASADGIRNPAIYEDENGTVNLFYRVSAGTDKNDIGLATGSSILPNDLTDQGIVITDADVQTALGYSGLSDHRIHDIVVIDGTAILYGASRFARSGFTPRTLIWYAEAADPTDLTSLTVQSVIFDPEESPRSGYDTGGVSVFSVNGTYYMTVMLGTGDNAQHARETYSLVGDGREFQLRKGVVVDTEAGEWDERWTYGGQWLKKQTPAYDELNLIDGSARLFYNGQPDDSSSTGKNGAVGLKEFDTIPRPNVLPAIRTTSIPLTGADVDLTITTTSADSYVGGGVPVPSTAAAFRLKALVEHQDAGETANLAVNVLDWDSSQSASGASQITKTGTGLESRLGDAVGLGDNQQNLFLAAWVSGGGTGARVEGASALCYSNDVRDEHR